MTDRPVAVPRRHEAGSALDPSTARDPGTARDPAASVPGDRLATSGEMPLLVERGDHRTVLFSERLADRLPMWMGSIRVRLAVLYSLILFVLGALVIVGIYAALSRQLDSVQVARQQDVVVAIPGPDGTLITGRPRDVDGFLAALERATNERTLENLRRYSFYALGMLFLGSLVVGWFVSGIVLRPIHRITRVAREIQATDLSRRINLRGPNDELRQLGDTFDAMLARLDAAFEGQRRFIQEASHELRNPIAVIRTNLDVALSDPDVTVEELREVGQVVGRTAERMSTLVDDLLVYARREEPAQRAGLIDVAPLVNDAAAEFRAAAETNQVTLAHVSSPGLWVLGDATRIRQALANLLANALRYAPPGSVVRLAAGAEAGWIWLSVEDQGPGVALENQDKVWLRFWRGDRKRAREEGRSGLGLTIVKQIVERHQGRVQLLSEPGRGATFVLWMPEAKAPMAPAIGSEGTSGVWSAGPS